MSATKSKKKRSELIIEADLSSIYKKQVKEFWVSEKETLDLKEAVKKAVKSTREHFKKEKKPWAINAGMLAEDISYNFIGISPYKLAAAALADVADFVYQDGEWKFVAKSKKRGRK